MSQTGCPRPIVCAGPLELGRGFREAIWATDILRQLLPDIQLLIAGSGPRCADLLHLIDSLEMASVKFLNAITERQSAQAA